MNIQILQQSLRDITYPNDLPLLLNVGLTGSIGVGKSTVAQILKDHGAAVIDMDAIARDVTACNGTAIAPIRVYFGDGMIADDGSLNRPQMRALIFQDANAKSQLEAIIHPLIRVEALRQARNVAAQEPAPTCLIYDIPLLYGNQDWLALLDMIVVVTCHREVQIQRVLQRNPDYTVAMIKAILNTQASNEELLKIANVIVDNSVNATNHLRDYIQINILHDHIEYLSHLKTAKVQIPQ